MKDDKLEEREKEAINNITAFLESLQSNFKENGGVIKKVDFNEKFIKGKERAVGFTLTTNKLDHSDNPYELGVQRKFTGNKKIDKTERWGWFKLLTRMKKEMPWWYFLQFPTGRINMDKETYIKLMDIASDVWVWWKFNEAAFYVIKTKGSNETKS